jgi:hypothetical protein
MANGLDRRIGAEFLAEPPDAHVNDVRARIEVVAPHLREQALPAHDHARVLDEVVQEAKLAIGEVCDELSDARLSSCEIEAERAYPYDVLVPPDLVPSQLNAQSGHELVERKRLRQVVACTEPETAELRRQVGARRDDQHRYLGHSVLQLPEH